MIVNRVGMFAKAAFVAATLTFGASSFAQDNWEDEPPKTGEPQAGKSPQATDTAPIGPSSKAIPTHEKSDLEKGLESYNLWVFEHREKAFEQQHVATWVIFTVVHALILFGAVLSWLQFRRGSSEDVTTLKLNREGIAVSSPILGVIILSLSLAFYYLYIAHVYEIKPVAEKLDD